MTAPEGIRKPRIRSERHYQGFRLQGPRLIQPKYTPDTNKMNATTKKTANAATTPIAMTASSGARRGVCGCSGTAASLTSPDFLPGTAEPFPLLRH
jgi:hypothetical protein